MDAVARAKLACGHAQVMVGHALTHPQLAGDFVGRAPVREEPEGLELIPIQRSHCSCRPHTPEKLSQKLDRMLRLVSVTIAPNLEPKNG
jgi:hypothetical protein